MKPIIFNPRTAIKRIKQAITKGNVIYDIRESKCTYNAPGDKTCILGSIFTLEQRKYLQSKGGGPFSTLFDRGLIQIDPKYKLRAQYIKNEFRELQCAFDNGELVKLTEIFDLLDWQYGYPGGKKYKVRPLKASEWLNPIKWTSL